MKEIFVELAPLKSSEVLIKARSLIQNPENWNQGNYARNEIGVTSVYSPTACNFCSAGAIEAAQHRLTGKVYNSLVSIKYLDEAVYPEKNIIRYNDKHTHAEVLAAFDKAIELAKKAGD